MVPSWKINIVIGIGAPGAAHIFGIVGILERENDAIHGQLLEVWISAVLGVEFGRALERIRLLAEFLAHSRRARWQRPIRGTAVTIAFARHGALASNVECAERVHLTCIGHADGHAVLLLYARIGRSRLHPAKLNRRPSVLIKIG